MTNSGSPAVKPLHLGLVVTFLALFIWSAIRPHNWMTWLLEVTPFVVVLIAVLLTYNKFRLTTPVYLLIWLAGIIALIGGHYTYGQVPLFNLLKDTLNLGRNYYDRLAHFIFGLLLSLLLRELLIRKFLLPSAKTLVMFILVISLGLSALYELTEWGVAMLFGAGAEAFLGLQGDIWDTHWDMFLALCGSATGVLVLSGLHNKYLAKEVHF